MTDRERVLRELENVAHRAVDFVIAETAIGDSARQFAALGGAVAAWQKALVAAPPEEPLVPPYKTTLPRFLEAAAPPEEPCPYVRTSVEGTSYCTLAAAPSLPPEPSDEQLLTAFVAGCNRENELSDAELSPENIRAGIAAAMRAALHEQDAVGSPEPTP